VANSSRQWIDLKILRESNPVQVAEYVTARNIADEPAFAWWVPYVLGIEVPTSVKHAIEIDRKNKNTFWADALKKEMGNVCVAFEILGQNAKSTPRMV